MAISAWPVESEGIAYLNEFGVGTELAEWSVEREGECYLRVRHVKFVIENRIPMWVGVCKTTRAFENQPCSVANLACISPTEVQCE